MQGWISLHRKMLQSDIFQNEKMFKIFMYCLMKASHKDRKQRIGMQVVELVKGQFVFGRKVAAVELNMNESTVYQYMKILEEDDVITIDSNNKFSVVSVVNWCFYQDNSNNVTTKEQQNNNRVTTEEQQNNTNNNVNHVENVNNVNKEISPKVKTTFDETHYQLAELLYTEMLKNTPNLKKPNLEKWSDDIRKLMTINKRTYKEINYIILWSQSHSFWKPNIRSASKLRDKFDTLYLQAEEEHKKRTGQLGTGKQKLTQDDWANM